MRYTLLAIVLIGASILGGCDGGVLDPKGPVALAERQILFNASGAGAPPAATACCASDPFSTTASLFWLRTTGNGCS
jgi:hypothetical protein